ncbi:MAG: hypothetical protein IH944_02705 [Armatimonadetes bacterium]|nr:hypothetical protein [Armatimonadota bacterium]
MTEQEEPVEPDKEYPWKPMVATKIKRLSPSSRRAWQALLEDKANYPSELVGVLSKSATRELIDKTRAFREKHEGEYKEKAREHNILVKDRKPTYLYDIDVIVAHAVWPEWRERRFFMSPSFHDAHSTSSVLSTEGVEEDIYDLERIELRDGLFKANSPSQGTADLPSQGNTKDE